MGLDPQLLRLEQFDDVQVVELVPPDLHDIAAVEAIQAGLELLVDGEPAMKLVVDFRNVTGVSSALLGALIALRHRLMDSGGAIRLCAIDTIVQQPFRMTKLDHVFAIDEDRGAAVAALKSGCIREG